MQDNQQKNNRIPYASRTEMMLLIIFGVIHLGLFAVLASFEEIASLTPDEKNSLSHRGRAIKIFAEKFADIMTEKNN